MMGWTMRVYYQALESLLKPLWKTNLHTWPREISLDVLTDKVEVQPGTTHPRGCSLMLQLAQLIFDDNRGQ